MSVAPGAIRTRNRLDCLVLLIPFMGEPRELIPKRSKDPRVTSNIGNVEGLKALDLKPPNREEPLLRTKFEGRCRLPYSWVFPKNPLNWAHGRTAVTSISTRNPGLASPATWNTERVGKFGCSLVPKNWV